MTSQITVLPFNINFKGLTLARIQKICEFILSHKPDIVCLQEVPREMVKHFLQMEQYPHHFGATFQHPYDTIILSRFPCIRYDRFPLPETKSSRNLLLVEIVLPSKQTIFVGTFHLDSVFGETGSEQERLKLDQLSYIGSILEDKPYVIAGDTNLTDNGKTTIPNLNEQDSPATFNKNRFDRIFVSSDFTNSPAQVIGDTTHSDHRGLIASFTLIISQSEQ
jgi:endonuclease/exonuclease/phosphatase family metal-dependent hydrolase